MDLNLEQRELLQELSTSEAWPALIKFCDVIISQMGEQVLKLNVEDQSKLVLAKARYEGARQLAVAINSMKENFREKRPSPKTGRK